MALIRGSLVWFTSTLDTSALKHGEMQRAEGSKLVLAALGGRLPLQPHAARLHACPVTPPAWSWGAELDCRSALRPPCARQCAGLTRASFRQSHIAQDWEPVVLTKNRPGT